MIDLETGMVRDINIINNFCGATIPYAFFDQSFSDAGSGRSQNWVYYNQPIVLGPFNVYWDVLEGI